MFKLVPLCAFLLLAACAGSSPTPASSPPTASSTSSPQPAGATEAQGPAMLRDDLKVELAAVDAALADLKTRVGAARDDAKDSMKQQLAALETRELELQAQVKQTEALVGAETEKARLGIHRAIVDLSMDVTQLAYRLSH